MKKQELLELFGQRVKTLRGLSGITQKTLADSASVTVEHISRIERGVTRCRIETAYVIANTLNVEMRDLFSFDDTSIDTHATAYKIFKLVASQSEEQQEYWHNQITNAKKVFGDD